MSSTPVNVAKLQLDTPVYSKENKLVGRLRFSLADSEPPFVVYGIVLNRGAQGPDVTIPVASIESAEGFKISLSLTEAEIAEAQEYYMTNERDYREQQPVYTRKPHRNNPNHRNHYRPRN